MVPCFNCSSKNRLIFLWSYFTIIFVSEEKIIVKTSHLPFLILELIRGLKFLYIWRTPFSGMFLFSSISSLCCKHKPDGISIIHMKLTFFVLWILEYKCVWEFSRSAPWWTPSWYQGWGIHPNSTSWFEKK